MAARQSHSAVIHHSMQEAPGQCLAGTPLKQLVRTRPKNRLIRNSWIPWPLIRS
ncbi:hypothetical protein HMPREF3038_01029 [Akkermansia sp. KLE1797]|nr:hypothetical protein HMPREF3038_01029 [Akkermansia sp. KLE1797]KXU53392.1 hypothetical protein HMPREF3039_02393 [Akkermansia sp. KLE1798]